MSTEIKAMGSEFPNSFTTEQLYCSLLGGNEIPNSPEIMPAQVFLPAEVLGNLEEAMLDTERDRLVRAQTIGWDTTNNVYVYSPVHEHTFGTIPPPAINRKQKDLVGYLTHPHAFNASQFNQGEIFTYKLIPYIGYFLLLGHSDGVTALLQTQRTSHTSIGRLFEASCTFLHLHEAEDGDLAERLGVMREITKTNQKFASERVKNHSAGLFNGLLEQAAELYEREGYGYYIWQPDERVVLEGDFRQGITLQRVLSPKSEVIPPSTPGVEQVET